MKRIALLILALAPAFLFAQITITNNDLPSVNDGYVVSNVTNPLPIEPGTGGANQTWDFSTLPSNTVTLDTFVSVGSTPLFMQLVFNNFLDPAHDADLAQSVTEIDSLFGLPLSGFYWFYQLENDNYEVVGFGANVSGIDIPVSFGDVDRIYDLPLTYNQTTSGTASFSFDIPTIGYIGSDWTRNTTVDGWGSITTPYGTFDCLRVKEELQYTDSVALDTLGGGQAIPRPLETRYKWLANGAGIPILEITTQTLLGEETTSGVRWKGTSTVGINERAQSATFHVFPNPAQGVASIWMPTQQPQNTMLSIITLDGRTVRTVRLSQEMETISLEGLAPGVYLLNATGYAPKRLVITG